MSEWVNCLDFNQRKIVVQLYVGGVSVSAISRIYQVNLSPVRYHLKKAGVYTPGRRPTVTFSIIKKNNSGSSLDFKNVRGNKLKNFTEDIKKETQEEKNFPTNYLEYLKRDQQRHASHF